MEGRIRTVRESVTLIRDGDVAAIGNQKPMALLREVVRQKKRGLTVYIMTGDYEIDLLCGARRVSPKSQVLLPRLARAFGDALRLNRDQWNRSELGTGGLSPGQHSMPNVR